MFGNRNTISGNTGSVHFPKSDKEQGRVANNSLNSDIIQDRLSRCGKILQSGVLVVNGVYTKECKVTTVGSKRVSQTC